ncbi:hypothetical protein HPB51_018522 [Rhipicephalus microplus]|uniref:Uncharacterized protein n=1 Tax=Rhipicephalus microplus TaxID=6941 RepID=A0A9J6EHX3_RHIMP|nr:hypothetical protein HPB51_018522 [Rhipicephalus microplus]
MSTVTNIEGSVTDHLSSRPHKFQFLSKAYFLPYAGPLGSLCFVDRLRFTADRSPDNVVAFLEALEPTRTCYEVVIAHDAGEVPRFSLQQGAAYRQIHGPRVQEPFKNGPFDRFKGRCPHPLSASFHATCNGVDDGLLLAQDG